MSSQNPFDPQQGGRSLHQNTPLPLHMPWGSYHDDPCSASVVFSFRFTQLRILEQAAGHLRWNVDYQPSQPVGSGFKPHWRPQPAKLPSFGGYSLETLPYLAPGHTSPFKYATRLIPVGRHQLDALRGSMETRVFERKPLQPLILPGL